MKCPKCGCPDISRNNFVWTDTDQDGKPVGKSVLQLTVQCKSCNFGGVYPEFTGEEELGKWR